MVCFNNVVATTLLVTLLLNFSNAIQIEHLPLTPASTSSAEPIVFNNGITVANEGKTFTLPCGGRGVSSFQWHYLQDGKTDTTYVYDGKNLTNFTDIDYDRIRINGNWTFYAQTCIDIIQETTGTFRHQGPILAQGLRPSYQGHDCVECQNYRQWDIYLPNCLRGKSSDSKNDLPRCSSTGWWEYHFSNGVTDS